MNENKIKIIPLGIHHLDCIEELENRCFKIPWTKKMFEDELKNPLARYQVITVEDKIAGYSGIWHIHGEGHITNIAVDLSFRGLGLGKMLIDKMIGDAINDGVDALTLEVRKSNESALRLYKKCGFKGVGIRKGYYSDNGEDAVIMWRKL
jgi:ribosomal-protein-alanine N-acetyltransferase